MSLDECLRREIDNVGKAPKTDVKFNTPMLNSNDSLTECGAVSHQIPYLSSSQSESRIHPSSSHYLLHYRK
jgi:hypothetical protein